MFGNYLKTAWRNLTRNKSYALINIVGLSLGLASCIVILMWVSHELSYDRHHQNADRLYRVVGDFHSGDNVHDFARTAPLLAPTLARDFPEVEAAARFKRTSAVLRYEDKQFQEAELFFAEPQALQMFTFEMVRGDADGLLDQPDTIVLTQSLARKYFGDANPIGKTMFLQDSLAFTVTGVMRDLPSTTHFQFEALLAWGTYERMIPERWLNTWANNIYYTYILLREGTDANDLAASLPAFADRHINDPRESGFHEELMLQPITDIHLHSHRRQEMKANGNATYVYIFSAVAILVLIIACVNFMNIATARSVRRGKEVGLRKVVGATCTDLVRQFLGEAILLAVLSMAIALLAVATILPLLNQALGITLNPGILGDWRYAGGLALLTVLVGALSGWYPALLLSAFEPAGIFRGALKSDTAGLLLRKGLVVFQFTLSIILIIAALVATRQLDFLRSRNLGFDKEQLLVIPFLWDGTVLDRYEILKNELLRQPGVTAVTASGDVPGRMATTLSYLAEGMPESESGGITSLIVDPDFLKTYGIDVVAGRDFDATRAADVNYAVILNEKAVAMLGWTPEEAVNKSFRLQSMQGEIIGVARDFNFNSLHQEIEPLAMAIWPSWLGYITARVSPADLSSTLTAVEQTWREIIPDRPYSYVFFDEDFGRQYRADERFRQIFVVFSGLAVAIACLGLFGLAAFATEQRIREIGIRKVLGAGVRHIFLLLTKDIFRLVALAGVLAVPLAYWLSQAWLQDFAYRTTLHPGLFVLAIAGAMLISLLTVSYQVVRAALVNVVETLRRE